MSDWIKLFDLPEEPWDSEALVREVEEVSRIWTNFMNENPRSSEAEALQLLEDLIRPVAERMAPPLAKFQITVSIHLNNGDEWGLMITNEGSCRVA